MALTGDDYNRMMRELEQERMKKGGKSVARGFLGDDPFTNDFKKQTNPTFGPDTPKGDISAVDIAVNKIMDSTFGPITKPIPTHSSDNSPKNDLTTDESTTTMVSDTDERQQKEADVTTATESTKGKWQPGGRGRPPKYITEQRKQQARDNQNAPQTDGLPTSGDVQKAVMDLFVTDMETKISDRVEEKTAEAVSELVDYLDQLKEEIKAHKRLTVVTERGEKELTGLMHELFPKLLKLCARKFPIMMVGSAGSGKTFACEQAAEALDLPFYTMSVGAQTTKSDILGFMHAGGEYITTQFRQAFEHGGVFLMDEIDAGNANVLVILNAALAGHYCAFPDRVELVKKHKDFIFVSTANTFGTGASRQYVGRNQIDAATLDRFVTIEWKVDETLEATIVSSLTNGERWHKVTKGLRKFVEDRSYRVIVSPRATIKGAELLDDGFTIDEVIEMVILPTANSEQRPTILSEALRLWRYY